MPGRAVPSLPPRPYHLRQPLPRPLQWLGGAAAFPSSSSCRPRGQVGGGSLLPHPGPGRELQGACSSFPRCRVGVASARPHPGSSHGAGPDYSHPSPGPEGFLELSSTLETPSGRPWLTLCSGENPQVSLQDPTKSVGGGALGWVSAKPRRAAWSAQAWLTRTHIFLCALTGGKQKCHSLNCQSPTYCSREFKR